MSAIDFSSDLIDDGGFLEQLETKQLSAIDAKINHVWLAAAASLCIIGAVTGGLTVPVNYLLLHPSIPLVLATGAIIWYARCNPEPAPTLQQLIDLHGWDKLDTVLTPEAFEAAFSAHVEEMDLKNLIAFYEEAQLKLQGSGLQIPSPAHWRAKFETETVGLSASQIAADDRWPLDKLLHYHIITHQMYDLLQKTREVRSSVHKAEMGFEEETKKRYELQRNEAKKLADTLQDPILAQQKEFNAQYQQNVKNAENAAHKQTQEEQARVLAFAQSHPEIEGLDVNFEKLKKQSQEACASIKSALEEKLKLLQKEHQQATSHFEEALKKAAELKAESYQIAEEKYARALQGLQQDLQQQLAASQLHLQEMLAKIDLEYDLIRP